MAAAALAGNGAKTKFDTGDQSKIENLAETPSAANQAFAKKYVAGGEEHILLLKLSECVHVEVGSLQRAFEKKALIVSIRRAKPFPVPIS